MDGPDKFVIGLVSSMWVTATVYLFIYHSDTNFMTWASLSVTMGGIYHWLIIRDSKIPDALDFSNPESTSNASSTRADPP